MSNRVYSVIFAGLLLVADFESGTERNNVDGGHFGVWERNETEDIRSCRMSFFEPGRKGSDYCLKLEYDVGPPNSPYAGLWLLFDDLDLTPYKALSFWAKGDRKAGYTRYFKVEFKNDNESAYVVTPPISDGWRKIEIPLSRFNIKDRTGITEFVIIFEDKQVSRKKGVIYIDDIALEK